MDNLEMLYEEQKDKIKVIKCNECEEEFLLLSVKIDKLIIDDSKHGLHFVCRYFLCPKCRKPYIVCIDNSETLLLEQKFNMLRKRLDRKRRKGLLTEEDVEKLQRKRNSLVRKRDKLKKVYLTAFTEIAKKKLGEDNKNESTVADNTEKEEVK